MSPDSTNSTSANGLEPFRRRLDEIDEQIAKLLGERLDICREVAAYKSEHEIPMMQPDRVKIVRAGCFSARLDTTGRTRFIQGVGPGPSSEKRRCMSMHR